MVKVKKAWQWFNEARFGMFIHFGPYAHYGRGEQVLCRELLDHADYSARAAKWNPKRFDADAWAQCAKDAGMKYAVLTTRHHDGYCLWDSKLTDYTSAAQAPGRDFIAEYVRAFRKAGLRIGLYYSLLDWRIPAYWAGEEQDPKGWETFVDYIHGQVRELMTNYGQIDVVWFDGDGSRPTGHWRRHELLHMMRRLQPGILVNDRTGVDMVDGKPHRPGDFSTPEHHITQDRTRLWESCQVSCWRLWGYAKGERWRPTDLLLDMLVESAGIGGNLLLNVGPKPDGAMPAPFVKRMQEIGEWLKVHGEAIYGSDPNPTPQWWEAITHGRLTRRGKNAYLVIRFWSGEETIKMAGLKTRVKSAHLLTTGEQLAVRQEGDHVYISGLPRKSPTKLFPVIRLTCDGPPEPAPWVNEGMWQFDRAAMHEWALKRGESVMLDGHQPPPEL